MDTIPFKPHDPDAMFTETEGLVQLYDDELVLQMETKNAARSFVKGFARGATPR